MLSHSPVLLPILLASAASLAFVWPPEACADAHRVSGPHTHENLTIFFIHGPSAAGPVPLTLEEALEKGNVKVHETGTVAELEIENVGDEEVFVHAGDIVKGGQQDRVVTATLVMKGKSGRLPVSVFCVEAGRWAKRGSESAEQFASAKEMMPALEAKLAMKSRYSAAAARSSAGDQAAGAADPQGEVWRSVSNVQAALSSSLGAKVASEESETSLQLALENEKLAAAQKGYMDTLKGAGEKDGDVVGIAFAINGRINSADIYSSNALFRKLWPRLLKAAVTEAIGADISAPAAPAPTAASIDGFLKAAESGEMSELPSIDGQKLETRDGDVALDSATRRASGEVVHRNVLARH